MTIGEILHAFKRKQHSTAALGKSVAVVYAGFWPISDPRYRPVAVHRKRPLSGRM